MGIVIDLTKIDEQIGTDDQESQIQDYRASVSLFELSDPSI